MKNNNNLAERVDFKMYAAGQFVSKKFNGLKTGQDIEITGFDTLNQLRVFVRNINQSLMNADINSSYNQSSDEKNLTYKIGKK